MLYPPPPVHSGAPFGPLARAPADHVIMKTVLHELCHMVHDEHETPFWTLSGNFDIIFGSISCARRAHFSALHHPTPAAQCALRSDRAARVLTSGCNRDAPMYDTSI